MLCYVSGTVSFSAGSTEQRPWISLIYENDFFIRNDIGDEEVWDTVETEAWSRWSFAPGRQYAWEENPDLWPLKVEVRTEVPIDLSIWHNPPIVKVNPPIYVWPLTTELTFSMEPKMTVDPGLRITRRITPEQVPPGISEVQVEVTLELLRNPVINDISIPIKQGTLFALYSSNMRRGEIEVLRIRPVESRDVPFCWSSVDYWGNIGCSLHFDRMEIGQRQELSFIVTLNNTFTDTVKFRPTIALHLDDGRIWHSYDAELNLASPSIDLAVEGPVGEKLDITFSTRDVETPVDWEIIAVKGHDTLWLWWQGELEGIPQQFFFYRNNTIRREYPSYFVHGFGDEPMPRGEDPEEFCAAHYTFEAWINGEPVDLKLDSNTKPDPENEDVLLLSCLYRRDFPANDFSIGEYQLRGRWCSDLLEEFDEWLAEFFVEGCLELSGTLTVF